jgi:hypothetical protein
MKIFLTYYTGTSIEKRRTIQNILLDLEFFVTDLTPFSRAVDHWSGSYLLTVVVR